MRQVYLRSSLSATGLATIEPSEAVKDSGVSLNCHWIASGTPNLVFSSSTVKINFIVFTKNVTPFTTENYAYRRIFHFVNSALQAQMVFFSGQPLVQYPNRPDLLELEDIRPQLSLPGAIKHISSQQLMNGFHVANIADLFPYLRWALRDYYLSKFFNGYDGIMFCWRALASILRHISEGKIGAESVDNIKSTSDKLCIDNKIFNNVKIWANRDDYHGRHSTIRAAKRSDYIRQIFKRRFDGVIDESTIASMFEMSYSKIEASVMKDAVDLLPPSINKDEWEITQKFTQIALIKFIQYLTATFLSQLIGRGIPPVFGANPCSPHSLDPKYIPLIL